MSKNRDLANYGTAALEDASVSATGDSVVKRDASGNVSAVDVYASGNVGVGTSSPSDGKLHISGANYNQQLVIERTDTSSKFGLAGNANGGFQIYDVTAGDFTRFAIDNSGRVGIGTSSPVAKLDVAGDIFASGNVLASGFHARGRSAPYTSVSETGSGAMSIFGHNALTSYAVANRVVAPNDSWFSSFVRMYYNEGIAFHTTSSPVSAGDILYDSGNPELQVAGSAERARFTNDGYLRMSANSGGIQFNGDTSASNALDDYEEGVWTPIYEGSLSAPSITYNSQTQGFYTKIGNVVSVTCIIATNSVSGGSGTLVIGGLPFPQSSQGAFPIGYAIVEGVAFASNNPAIAIFSEESFGAQRVMLSTDFSSKSGALLQVSDLSSGFGVNRVRFMFTYRTNV